MSELKITAPVYKVLETQTFESGFSKRTLVLKTTGDYPQTIPFEFFKDKTGLLDNLKEGEEVTVYYNLQGSEYKGKFYANLNGWKVEAAQSQVKHRPDKFESDDPLGESDSPLPSQPQPTDIPDDDLPF